MPRSKNKVPRGRGHGGAEPVGADVRTGRSGPESHGRPESPGRSESSPGHLKKEAGSRSARDFAPGHREDEAEELAPGSALLRRV